VSCWLVLIVIGAIGRVMLLHAPTIPWLMAEAARPPEVTPASAPAEVDAERSVSTPVAHTDGTSDEEARGERFLHVVRSSPS